MTRSRTGPITGTANAMATRDARAREAAAGPAVGLFCGLLFAAGAGGRWRRGRPGMGSRRLERARERARRGRVNHLSVESPRAREAAAGPAVGLFCGLLFAAGAGGRWRRGRPAMGSRRLERARERARRGRVNHLSVESPRAREA